MPQGSAWIFDISNNFLCAVKYAVFKINTAKLVRFGPLGTGPAAAVPIRLADREPLPSAAIPPAATVC
jgi:hypothetical protein